MSLRLPQPSRGGLSYVGLLIAVFAYLFYARTHASSESLVLLRDQIRDWRIALGPLASLPLVGPQSTAGGAALGPVYYWVLWLSRVLIGPAVHNLPHAGAYGISILQGVMDLFLLDTLRRRIGSAWVALAAVLLMATASHDLAISSTIWNPAVSVAFVKLAIALRLRHGRDASIWWTAATAAAAWLAVQAHSAAVFVAAPIIASYVIGELAGRRIVAALQQCRAIVEVILLLQLPFFVHALTQSSAVAPTRALAGASHAFVTGNLRWADSLRSLLDAVSSILFTPFPSGAWRPLVVLLVLAAVLRFRRDLALVSTTVGPLAFAVLGLALWQGNYDEYWYLPVVPSAAIAMVVALTSWKTRATAPLLVLLMVAAQPPRLAHSLTWYRMPEYGPLVAGTTRIVRQTTTLRRLETTFRMPPLSDARFPYEVMGGQFSDSAAFDAVINERGEVQFRKVAD